MERKTVVNPECSTRQVTAVITPGPGQNYTLITFTTMPGDFTTLDDQRKTISHCRFCGEEKKCEELLDLTIDKETMERYLVIQDFFKIEFLDLSNDKIPKTTCEHCYDMIEKCYNFFLKVKDSQVVLNELYGDCDDADSIKLEDVEADLEDTEIEDQVQNENNFTNPESISTLVASDSEDVSSDSSQSQSSNRELHAENELCQSNVASDLKDCSSDFDSRIVNFYLRTENNFKKLPETIHSNSNETNTSELIVDSDDSQYVDDEQSSDYNSENEFTLQYCGMPIYLNSEIDTESWDTYSYSCKHCYEEFHSMDDLREHGMQLHRTCRVFECADCRGIDVLHTFNTFIAHVREHRDNLRYYCSYCNKHFESISECSNHEISHSSSAQICDWCGEICPSIVALKRHKGIEHFKPLVVTPARLYNGISVSLTETAAAGNWVDYEWACHVCNLRCNDVQSLREHTQSAHGKCFSMKCADCSRIVSNYRTFVAHVGGHRPHLKKYCPYCNKRIEDTNELKKHVDGHHFSSQRPCDGCGQTFPNKALEDQHMEQFAPKRLRKFLTPQDLTCDVCNKMFKFIQNLRQHREVHKDNSQRQKDHVCSTCGKQFVTKGNLKGHVLSSHDNNKTHICLICNKSFFAKRNLKQHVLRHERRTTFICDYCGKGFYDKRPFIRHIATHTNVDRKKYECVICSKVFYWSYGLKLHMNVHTNAKPYKCQNCAKCFNNWPNCNKHMVRIHGTSLTKKILTDEGEVPEKRVQKVNNLGTDKKEWLQDILKHRRSKKNNNDRRKSNKMKI